MTGYQSKKAAAEKKVEPPAWWPAVENILKEYGLQAIDFVADFKEAIANAEHEPVAWMTFNACGDEDDIWFIDPKGQLLEGWTYKPLYTSPPQRRPLTDEEIDAIADEFIVDYRIPAGSHCDFARAIEAAHGIKGEA